MKPLIPMRQALADPHLFEPMLGGETWRAWRVLMIAAMGEALDDEERAIFEKLTGGRPVEPLALVECMAVIAGRRGGKSRAASVLAAYIAALCDHSAATVPGERPLVLCLSQNQKQGAVTFNYIAAIFNSTPLLAEMISGRTADSLSLSNGVSIEVRAASFRGLRGVTAVAVLADESCFWRTDETSRNADSEILDAVRPALATTGGPLILISSPYSRRGETWEIYKRHYGPQGDPLVIVAAGASRDFNPSLPQRVVDRAMEADAASGAAEYLGQWRTDIEAFISREAVEAVIEAGAFERGYIAGQRYFGFTDAAGGSGQDSYTLGIAHRENEIVMLDAVREARPPFSPESITKQFAELLKAYHIATVQGDRYAGDWPGEQFRRCGVDYKPSERTTSENYGEMLPMINSGKCSLLDHARMAQQIIGLERKTSRSGKDSISHAPNAHDDIAASVAGALVIALEGEGSLTRLGDFLVGGEPAQEPVSPMRVAASIVCGARGAHAGIGGAAIFSVLPANSPFRVVLVDVISSDFGAPFLAEVYLKLQKWSDRLKPHHGFVAVADGEIARTYNAVMAGIRSRERSENRLDPRARLCGIYRPELLARSNLAATAAAIVSSGAVKIGADLLDQSARLPIASLLDFRTDDPDEPLKRAIILGIATSMPDNAPLTT